MECVNTFMNHHLKFAMEIEIRVLKNTEHLHFASLIEVFAQVFGMIEFNPVSEEYLKKLLCKEDFIVCVAISGHKVIGGLTAYQLQQYYVEKKVTYIYDLAVLEEWQRNGIGRSIIAHMIEWCKKEGHAEIFVQADRIDDYALDFYRKTRQTTEEDVIHYTYNLIPSFKELFG